MKSKEGEYEIFVNDDTDEIKFKVSYTEDPHVTKSTSLKLVQILKGFWVDENDKELKQIDSFNKDIYFGQKVKIKLITSNADDDEEIEVEVKARQGDEYINLTDNKDLTKFSLKVKNNEAFSEAFYLYPHWYNENQETGSVSDVRLAERSSLVFQI